MLLSPILCVFAVVVANSVTIRNDTILAFESAIEVCLCYFCSVGLRKFGAGDYCVATLYTRPRIPTRAPTTYRSVGTPIRPPSYHPGRRCRLPQRTSAISESASLPWPTGANASLPTLLPTQPPETAPHSTTSSPPPPPTKESSCDLEFPIPV